MRSGSREDKEYIMKRQGGQEEEIRKLGGQFEIRVTQTDRKTEKVFTL